MIILATNVFSSSTTTLGQRKLAYKIMLAYDKFKLSRCASVRKEHFLEALCYFRELKRSLNEINTL